MISTVVNTGTLVNRDATSNDARMPVGCVVCRMERKSSVEFIWYLAGRYGVIILFNSLTVL